MKFDYAVLGSGSAGTIIASRLSEDPSISVALIEAGPDYPDPDTLPAELKYGYATAAFITTVGHLWNYVAKATEGQQPTPLPRGKVVGGTSAINGQVFLRGTRQDFDDWVALGNADWSFDSVLPFFKKIENDLDFDDEWHNQSGPITVRRYSDDEMLPAQIAFREAALNLGFADCPDANRPDATGVGPIPLNNAGHIRASTAAAYLAPARDRPNLTVMSDTMIRRLRVQGSRVVGVEADGLDGDVLVDADEYILSCGVIGSPHVLMLSGVGDADQLRRAGVDPTLNLPGVGQRIADHQVVDLVWEVDASTAPPGDAVPRVQMALRYTAQGSSLPDDMQMTVRTAAPGRHGEPLVSLAPLIELPLSTGTVTVVSSDPRVQPQIDLRFLSHPDDVRRLREGIELALELAAEPALAKLLHRKVTPTLDQALTASGREEWMMAAVRTSHHQAGTCGMGAASDSLAVVDRRARVHGIDNLRVADASIMPQLVRANTNVTTMMIGERVATFALDDRRR